MMNKEILDHIYNGLNAEDKADNPFETLQTDTPYEAFYKEYIKPLEETDLERCNDMCIAFMDALVNERKQAFKVGYNTAIKQIFAALTD